jgi:hypothetical protein
VYIFKVQTVVWNSPVHSVCVLDNGVHYLYTDVPLECVNFFSFQIYNRVPNPRWTTIPNFIWVTPYVLAIAYGEFIIVDLELCPFWHLLWIINCMLFNHISGIMVSLLASSVVDRGFEPWLVKPQTIKLVFVASALSTQQSRSNS